jgi:hypothetical protein
MPGLSTVMFAGGLSECLVKRLKGALFFTRVQALQLPLC